MHTFSLKSAPLIWQPICLCILFPTATGIAAELRSDDAARWWPKQAMPTALVRLEQGDFPSLSGSYAMTAQSVAGLAAKAVNEGRHDEMVWTGTGNPELERWYSRLFAQHSSLKKRGAIGAW